mmetsp:Transcript_100551/g.174605  ORF Transcript_100551/g.174605 Transcript_100551/m.174605 type:complete len:160 (+) Transcript_100551:108-587(+)
MLRHWVLHLVMKTHILEIFMWYQRCLTKPNQSHVRNTHFTGSTMLLRAATSAMAGVLEDCWCPCSCWRKLISGAPVPDSWGAEGLVFQHPQYWASTYRCCLSDDRRRRCQSEDLQEAKTRAPGVAYWEFAEEAPPVKHCRLTDAVPPPSASQAPLAVPQ